MASLRPLLQSKHLEFLVEAHNGISARIAEEAGFAGIWASGLALSAQFGVRDSNEASWTQIVDMLEFMADASPLPILLDGDTGYGNFNNLRRLVRKLEQRSIAGVCIEDKLFPKTNSFIASEHQQLADVDEFCGKLKAGKDSQQSADFCLVARVEALVCGCGLAEALKRAEAYRQAGADALLIHSRQTRPDEILAFAREWASRCPLIIVPTRYSSTPTQVFREAGIQMVIWANPMIRASIQAMQSVARELHRTQSLAAVEDRIASLEEVFRLQGAEELLAAEARYARPAGEPTGAIVLGATRGEGLQRLTAERPKTMISVGGKPLLRHLIDECHRQGIREVTVVTGYRPEAVDLPDIHKMVNPDHESTGELVSLHLARDSFRRDCLVLYGDLLFRGYILRELLEGREEVVIAVDSSQTEARAGSGQTDLAYCTAADDRGFFGARPCLQLMSTQALDTPAHGRWAGMACFRGQGRAWVQKALEELQEQPDFARLGLPDLLNHLVKQGHPVHVCYIHGHWLDVNDLEDLEPAAALALDKPR